MKKLLERMTFKKWIVLIVSTWFIAAIIHDVSVRGEFNFTDFKDGKTLVEYLDKKFPEGADANLLIKLIENAGAICEKYINDDNYLYEKYVNDNLVYTRNYDYTKYCDYRTGLLTLHPWNHYRLIIWVDKFDKIVNTFAEKTIMLEAP